MRILLSLLLLSGCSTIKRQLGIGDMEEIIYKDTKGTIHYKSKEAEDKEKARKKDEEIKRLRRELMSIKKEILLKDKKRLDKKQSKSVCSLIPDMEGCDE